MKYSYSDIVKSLPAKKNSNSSLWVKMLIRKISFFFTFIFINMGFSPNAVSVLSILIVVLSCLCFAIGTLPSLIIAVVLINFWLVLDCVDGNIARCKKMKTVYGEFVDDASGYFLVAFVYLAMGLYVYNVGGVLVTKANQWFLVAGAVSSICDILARLINKDYQLYSLKRSDYVMETYTNENKKSLSYIRRRVGKELGISGLFMPLTILCTLFNAFDLMTLFYLAFNGFALLSTTVLYIYKANKYDKEC